MSENPPVPPRATLIGLWLAVAALSALLLTVVGHHARALDDPDQALQRPGFLDARPLPGRAPAVSAGIPRPGRRAVVFFARTAQRDAITAAVRADRDLLRDADVAVVVATSRPLAVSGAGVALVADEHGAIAVGYAMRRPVDGGRPVGYAVVDRAGRVRYATLDGDVAEHLPEVRTVLEATP